MTKSLESGQLRIESGDSLLEHVSMGRGRGAPEVGDRPRPGKLERTTSLQASQLISCRRPAWRPGT